jgi:DNA-binding LacI/PurR family transcriptional regulator
LITLKDLAKKTGYSKTTISKVLNDYTDVSEKAREEILKAVEEMHYIPNSNARTLSKKKSWTIGILYLEALGLGIKHPFFNAVLESFKKESESKGYDLMFISKGLGGKNIGYLDHCKIRSIDGLIIFRSIDKEIKDLIESDIPCVVLDFDTDKASTVYSDNSRGSYIAVDYLHSLGHQKIAHIHGDENTFAGKQRKMGYEVALEKHGIPKREEYIVNGGYFSVESGYKAMQNLLQLEERPTAVYVAGDYMAIGAIKAIREYGLKVPDDISVIGFDDIDVSQFVTPSLTTIKQNTVLLGKKASKMLIDQIEDRSGITNRVVPVELVVRESCKKVSKYD